MTHRINFLYTIFILYNTKEKKNLNFIPKITGKELETNHVALQSKIFLERCTFFRLLEKRKIVPGYAQCSIVIHRTAYRSRNRCHISPIKRSVTRDSIAATSGHA